MIHEEFEKHVLYFNIDKIFYEGITCNRALLLGNEICFGEGIPQLKLKEELRIALASILASFETI